MSVAAGDITIAVRGRVGHGTVTDEYAAALPSLRNSPDVAGRLVRCPFLDVIKQRAGDLCQPAVIVDKTVELVAMEDKQAETFVLERILVKNLDANDMTDYVGWSIVVASDPHQSEIFAIGV